jgi:hypothetical protein
MDDRLSQLMFGPPLRVRFWANAVVVGLLCAYIWYLRLGTDLDAPGNEGFGFIAVIHLLFGLLLLGVTVFGWWRLVPVERGLGLALVLIAAGAIWL